MELTKPIQHIPNDIVKILLQFDGRIKYRNGHYVDIIHCDDERYAMLRKITEQKIAMLNNIKFGNNGNVFVFSVYFNSLPDVSITYYGIIAEKSAYHFDITYSNGRNYMFVRYIHP